MNSQSVRKLQPFKNLNWYHNILRHKKIFSFILRKVFSLKNSLWISDVLWFHQNHLVFSKLIEQDHPCSHFQDTPPNNNPLSRWIQMLCLGWCKWITCFGYSSSLSSMWSNFSILLFVNLPFPSNEILQILCRLLHLLTHWNLTRWEAQLSRLNQLCWTLWFI